MKLAAQLYTVREFMKNEDDIFESLKKIKKIGYDNVQVSGLGAFKPENLSKMLKELGLTVCATHTPLNRLLDETDAVIAEHKMYGCKYIGLGYYAGKSLEDYKKFLKDIMPVAEKIAENGMQFVYHNHAQEFIKFDGVCALDYMRDNTKPEIFGFLPDFYWVHTAGVNPLKFMRDYAGRFKVVHYKDMRAVSGEKSNMAEIFEGNMDYEEIHKACKASGVEYAAVEQDICDGDPFESLEKSYKNIMSRGLF